MASGQKPVNEHEQQELSDRVDYDSRSGRRHLNGLSRRCDVRHSMYGDYLCLLLSLRRYMPDHQMLVP